jgi:hypothetical protein
MPNAAMPRSFLGQAFDLGDPWAKSCLRTKDCFGWETPYSFNKTCWYEVSYIHRECSPTHYLYYPQPTTNRYN